MWLVALSLSKVRSPASETGHIAARLALSAFLEHSDPEMTGAISLKTTFT